MSQATQLLRQYKPELVLGLGGYVAAVALRAIAAEAPPDLEPASFTCQFLSTAKFDSVDIEGTTPMARNTSRRHAPTSPVASRPAS